MRYVPIILLLSSLASIEAHAGSDPAGRILDRDELARAGTQAKAGAPHATRIIDLGNAFRTSPKKAVVRWRGHHTFAKVATATKHRW